MSTGAQTDWFAQNAPKKPSKQDWFLENAPRQEDVGDWFEQNKPVVLAPVPRRDAFQSIGEADPGESISSRAIRAKFGIPSARQRRAEREKTKQFREAARVPFIKRITGKSLQEFIEPTLPKRGEEIKVPFTQQAVQYKFGLPVKKKVKVGALEGMVSDSVRLSAGLLDFFGSPEGIAAAALALTGVGTAAVPTFYAAEQLPEAGKAIKEWAKDPGDPDKIQQALLIPGFIALLSGAAGKGIAKIRAKPVRAPVSQVKPEAPPLARLAPAPMREPPAIAETIDRVGTQLSEAGKTLKAGLSKEAETILKQAETIRETGTVEKGVRAEIRQAGTPQPQRLVSERMVQDMNAAIVGAAREVRGLRVRGEMQVDPVSRATLQVAEARFNKLAKEYRQIRRAAGRTVKRFDYEIAEELIGEFQEVGLLMKNMKNIQHREPMLQTIRDAMEAIRQGEGSKGVGEIGRTAISFMRLNLFPLFSFARDLFTNVMATSSRGIQAIPMDLWDGGARSAGMWRAIRGRPWRKLPKPIESQLGYTALGERFAPITGKPIDKLLALPAYLKTSVDSFFKRYGALSTAYEEANLQARQLGLRGREKTKWIDDNVMNMDEAKIARVVEEGNKLGFNRNLTRLEEQIANSRAVQLFMNAYPRWSFQFGRWLAEHTVVDPAFWSKVKRGTVTGADVVGFLTRNAEGIGGLYLVSETLYDSVDFNSMEYVREDGKRIRLTGLTPIPDALFLIAIVKGERDQALAALQASSLPAQVFSGLASQLVQALDELQRGRMSGYRVKREVTDFLTKLVPGQGLLRAIESLVDPTIREGVTAPFPGLSKLAPPRIDPTTGEPKEMFQEIPGIGRVPSTGGLGFPGAPRITTPVEHALLSHGIGLFRARRTPIAEFPALDVPDELRREYEIIAGRLVNEYVTLEIQDSDFWTFPLEERRKYLQEAISRAQSDARLELDARRGFPERPVRQPTLRERLLPKKNLAPAPMQP